MDEQRTQPSDLIQSVSRALRILEHVGAAPEGLSAKQIARRCRLPLATTYHLVRTLGYEGYLVRRPSGRYVLGLELASRFRDLMMTFQRPPKIHAVLRHLVETTGHTAYFSQIIDARIVITDLVEGPYSPHIEDLVVGFDHGAHATALGKALLSTMPLARRHEYLRQQAMKPFTPQTVTDAAQLDHELAGAASRAAFTEEGQFRREVCCAAVLIPRSSAGPGTIGFSANVSAWTGNWESLICRLHAGAADLLRRG